MGSENSRGVAAVLFLIVCSVPAHAETLEQLDSAANFLTSAYDKNQPKNFCEINAEHAQALLNALHPLIDAKLEASKSRSPSSWLQTCSSSCHCGVYGSVMDRKGDLTKPEQALRNRLYEKSKRESVKQKAACLRATKTWFCKSSLLRQLRKSHDQ